MKINSAFLILFLAWFAVIGQFVLMLQNRQTGVTEALIRFFSYFTILTNVLVALYFSTKRFGWSGFVFRLFKTDGALTAITTFIFIVGLVYQLVLRHLWSPTGLQFIVDELLHSVIPLAVLLYWFFNVERRDLTIKSLIIWLLYPIVYLFLVLVRGHFSEFYPYPFLNVTEIGYSRTFANVGIIFGIALLLMSALMFIGRLITKNQSKL